VRAVRSGVAQLDYMLEAFSARIVSPYDPVEQSSHFRQMVEVDVNR
jgi:hypothetical protein